MWTAGIIFSGHSPPWSKLGPLRSLLASRTLLEFSQARLFQPCTLGQFQLSFPAESRRTPRSFDKSLRRGPSRMVEGKFIQAFA